MGGVDHHGNDVDVLQAFERGLVELLSEGVVGLMDARRVDEDELEIVARQDGAEAVTGRLGGRGGDGDLLAHDGVQKRRLARVRTSDKGCETRLEAFFLHS